jgi:hypothetical protein
MSAPCPTFGFIVRATADRDAGALRRTLTERLAPAGLLVDDRRETTIVITREGCQATESDRQLVIALLADELNVGNATVSDLIDLNS